MNSKAVVITGGSNGIGLSLAKKYAKDGMHLHLIARDESRLQSAKEEILELFPDTRIQTYSCDVSEELKIKAIIHEISKQEGYIRLLILSAGYSHPGYFEDLTPEVHKKTMDINYFGTLWPIQEALPFMKSARKGSIVMISSGAALYGTFGSGAYTPAKSALTGLSEVLRFECKPYNVQIHIAYPPDTDTDMFLKNRKRHTPEALMIMGAGGEYSVERVSNSIYSDVKRGKFRITTGPAMFILKRFKSLIYPLVNGIFDRKIARFQKKKLG